MKKCSVCKNIFSLDQFRKDSSRKDGLHCTCNTCNIEIQRRWYVNNKEKAKKKANVSYHLNKEKISVRRKLDRKLNPDKYRQAAKKQYKPHKSKEYSWKNAGILDMTIERYNELLNSQNNKCAICNELSTNFKKALSVDHNHKTGKVRGILCDNCNRALGYLKESEQIIINLLNYVRCHKEPIM